MKLDNRSPYHARLFRGGIDERRLFGSVAVRITYDIVGDRLRVAREQAWEISPAPWDSPQGPLPGDELFYRGGVDLLVFGAARSARPVPRLDLDLRVGAAFRSRLAVFGDRVWKRGPRGLVPSAPEPFRVMPLTLDRSFGGSFEWDGLGVGFPDNPGGRGYYADERAAEGQPLPNIEDPAALCARWDDRPEPVGTCCRARASARGCAAASSSTPTPACSPSCGPPSTTPPSHNSSSPWSSPAIASRSPASARTARSSSTCPTTSCACASRSATRPPRRPPRSTRSASSPICCACSCPTATRSATS
ncbi:DUF2169 domain-containing protein [Nannocystis pusilla]|uniref:DUF2169 domain-containing protein n=1 Tax=Nannocystis pusilla TaxID=889268 RepID=UPI003B7EFD39